MVHESDLFEEILIDPVIIRAYLDKLHFLLTVNSFLNNRHLPRPTDVRILFPHFSFVKYEFGIYVELLVNVPFLRIPSASIGVSHADGACFHELSV